MNPVVHFEVPYDDEERVKKFYSEVFGWQINAVEGMPYHFATTTEVGEDGVTPKAPGSINGGMYKRDEESAKTPVIVLMVDNCEDHVKKVEAAGGSVVLSVRQVGDMGIYAQAKDPEGNIIGLWQVLKKE